MSINGRDFVLAAKGISSKGNYVCTTGVNYVCTTEVNYVCTTGVTEATTLIQHTKEQVT